MRYKAKKFQASTPTINAQNTANKDESAVRSFYNKGYSQGAGGLKPQLNTAQQRLTNLYNNNNLSQQFNYSRQGEYTKALNDVANRGPFKYDINDDQLFQNAKEQYMQMGKTAMADTIGQASAMTGGYGNSYATTAGAQAYNAHIQQLNNSIGDYYKMALQAYDTESNRLSGVLNAFQTDRGLEQSEWKGNWDVYNNLYNSYSNDYRKMLELDQSGWKSKGEGLSSVAGLSANRAQNYMNNDISIWDKGESHRATQAQLAEQEEQNKFDRDIKTRQQNEVERDNKFNRGIKTRQQNEVERDNKFNRGMKTKEFNRQTQQDKINNGFKQQELDQRKQDSSWQRHYQQETLKLAKQKANKTTKTKKGKNLTSKQRTSNVQNLSQMIIKSYSTKNGTTDLTNSANRKNARSIANQIIKKAQKQGILDKKALKELKNQFWYKQAFKK